MPKDFNELYQQVLSNMKTPQQGFQSGTLGGVSYLPDNRKQKFSEYTPYSTNTVYTDLSDGTKVAMFENFLPGTNNQERLAKQQTASEKWGNGLQKFLSKTSNAIVGGTVGTVYGLGKAFDTGEFSSIYDNELSNWLADVDTKMNYQLPNYYTKQEQDLGLFGQATTANFWADKFLGGLSFTAGALVSEGIWAMATGGTSLATTGARWGAKSLGKAVTLKGISNYKTLLKDLPKEMAKATVLNKDRVIAMGKAGELLNTGRFMWTSAGYESSVEALQFKREAQENFHSNFFDLNGRQPTPEESLEFQENLSNASNSVFGVNMALVGSSNLVTMGTIMGVKSPIKTGLNDFLDRKAFGYGVSKTLDDVGKLSYKTLEATTGQKVARKLFNYGLKPMVMEGIIEEGGQGVTTKVGNKWLEHTYNPQNMTETVDMSGLIYEGLAEQYGTKEGWVENGLGMLIGMFGGSINARAEMNQKEAKVQMQSAGLNTFNQGTLQTAILQDRLLAQNRALGFATEAKQEEAKGNITASDIAQNGVIHSFLNHKYQLGEDFNEVFSEMSTAIDLMTEDQLRQAGIEPSQAQEFKEERKQEFAENLKQFQKNRKFAEYIVGKKNVGEEVLQAEGMNLTANEAMIQSLTWTLTAGEQADTSMKALRDKISQEVGVEQANTLEAISRIRRQGVNKKNQVTRVSKQYKGLQEERDKLVKQIQRLNAKPVEIEGNKVKGAQIASLNERLIEVNDKLSTLQTEADLIVKELNNQESYESGLSGLDFIPSQDFRQITFEEIFKIEDNLNEFDKLLEAYDESNPQRAEYLKDLIEEYQKAQDIFETNQRTVLMISSGRMNLESIATKLGAKIKGGKDMDSMTKEWLLDVMRNYISNKAQAIAPKEEAEATTVEEVVDKLVNGEELSEQEQNIEEQNKEQVKKEVQRSVVLPTQEIKADNLSDLEVYKQRIENLFKKNYHNLTYIGENYDEVSIKKPTQEELQEYRKLKEEKSNSARFQQLRQKLSDWKVLDSMVDEDNNSVAELVDLIQQLEQEVEQEETKDEITEEDVELLSDDIDSTETVTDYSLAQNVKGSVTVKKTTDGNFYRFSHVKIKNIAEKLQGEITVNKVPISSLDVLDNLKPNDVVTIDGADFKFLAGGVVEVSIDNFRARSQALNMYVKDTQAVTWSYKDVYTVKGEDFVKMDSEFLEDTQPEFIYEVQPGDLLSLEIAQDDYTDKLIKGKDKDKLKREFKIFVVDSKGRRLSTIKAQKEGVFNEKFGEIREVIFSNWQNAGFPTNFKTGVQVEAENIFMGSPELIMSDGVIQNISFTEDASNQVEATGYILDGELTLSKEIPDVNRTFVGKISKKNKGRKVPVVVFKKGAYMVAYPVSMVKSPSPLTNLFDGIANDSGLSPQEKVQRINEAIQSNRIQTAKLTYSDITNGEKIEEVRQAFANKMTFVSADDFANKQYKTSSLLTEAVINIDLENIDRAISDAKLRIKLDETVKFATERELKYESQTELENQLNDLALELYKDYTSNASTKYVNAKGDIIEDTGYTNEFDDNPVEIAQNQVDKIKNLRILERAFKGLTPSIRNIIGRETIDKVESLIKQYNVISSQIIVQPNNGAKNICK